LTHKLKKSEADTSRYLKTIGKTIILDILSLFLWLCDQKLQKYDILNKISNETNATSKEPPIGAISLLLLITEL